MGRLLSDINQDVGAQMYRVVLPRVAHLTKHRGLSLININTPCRFSYARAAATMATPYKVHITPENTGLLNIGHGLTPEAAEKVTELLQKDLDVSFTDHSHKLASLADLLPDPSRLLQ